MSSRGPLRCPRCARPLEAARAKRGVAWLCRSCRAGAMTLPVLQQVAPRAFALAVWQAARKIGRESALSCPSCSQPFLTLSGTRAVVTPELEICMRCSFVWFEREALRELPELPARAGAPRDR